ncbi:hypothetical protein Mal15_19760 [Stieleria maiorica]|uniref:Uncharacterized protein n=1 Tax=Stieleria maiorica TaxID=2795974 RepID=A0A5B9MD96_9BACT|nr:hypothetical protein Mal15_19760 [Stieleria maiorica]
MMGMSNGGLCSTHLQFSGLVTAGRIPDTMLGFVPQPVAEAAKAFDAQQSTREKPEFLANSATTDDPCRVEGQSLVRDRLQIDAW